MNRECERMLRYPQPGGNPPFLYFENGTGDTMIVADRGISGKRRHVRIRIDEGVQADLSVINVGGSDVSSRTVPVIVKNISPAGMRFVTHLRFPVSGDYTIRFKLKMGDWELGVPGHVVWRGQEENLYAYGCLFRTDRFIRRALLQAIASKLSLTNSGWKRIHDVYRQLGEERESVGCRLDLKS